MGNRQTVRGAGTREQERGGQFKYSQGLPVVMHCWRFMTKSCAYYLSCGELVLGNATEGALQRGVECERGPLGRMATKSMLDTRSCSLRRVKSSAA